MPMSLFLPRAVGYVMCSMLYPLVTFFLLCLCIAYWASTAVFLSTSNEAIYKIFDDVTDCPVAGKTCNPEVGGYPEVVGSYQEPIEDRKSFIILGDHSTKFGSCSLPCAGCGVHGSNLAPHLLKCWATHLFHLDFIFLPQTQ